MEENKKSKTGLIILIIIILLLILFAVWYFLLRDKGETNNGNSNNNNQQQEEQPKETKGYQYDYREGVLTPIVDENGIPKQNDFVIDGIILIGNRHGYDNITDTEAVIAKLVSEGYKKEGINSSFYLNEWIEFYVDTKYTGSESDVKVVVVPHRDMNELELLSLTQLEELADEKGGFVMDYKTPEEDNHKYIGNGYVNVDYPEGKYDILFTYKGKIAYFINVELAKEPME